MKKNSKKKHHYHFHLHQHRHSFFPNIISVLYAEFTAYIHRYNFFLCAVKEDDSNGDVLMPHSSVSLIVTTEVLSRTRIWHNLIKSWLGSVHCWCSKVIKILSPYKRALQGSIHLTLLRCCLPWRLFATKLDVSRSNVGRFKFTMKNKIKLTYIYTSASRRQTRVYPSMAK